MLDEMELVIHCNHWTWTPRGFFESLKKHRPDWYDVTMEIYELIKSDADYDEIRKTYSKYEPGKVELFTQKVYDDEGVQVVILPFKWIHITTWNDVYEYLNQIRKSTLQGKTVHVKSKNNIVINDTDAVVGLLGLEDIVVVKTEDALLICPKNMSGQIKDLLSEIESQGQVDHL